MSGTSTDNPGKPMEQPNNDLSDAMGQLSVTTDNSRKYSPSLFDMPIDVVSLIIERSKYKEQLKLRKVSKSLRALIDKLKPACTSIQVECCMENVNLIFDDQHVMYTKPLYIYEDKDDNGIVVLRDDFKKAAFDDLASTLQNPKLQLEKFSTSQGVYEKKDLEEYYNEIQCVLKSLNHQLSVKKVDLLVSSPSNLLSILSHLKPGVLEKITLSFDHTAIDWRNDSNGMDQIARLEQWKQAEELELEDLFDEFPMKHATHFKRFRFNEYKLDGDKFIRIRDFLSKSNNFEYCFLRSVGFHFEPNLIYQLLGEPVSSNTTKEIFHYFIPDSDYYLEITKAKKACYLEAGKKKQEGN